MTCKTRSFDGISASLDLGVILMRLLGQLLQHLKEVVEPLLTDLLRPLRVQPPQAGENGLDKLPP